MKLFLREWALVLVAFSVAIAGNIFTAYKRYCPATDKPDPLIVQLRAKVAELENDISTLQAKLLSKNQATIEAPRGQDWWVSNANNIGFQWLKTSREARRRLEMTPDEGFAFARSLSQSRTNSPNYNVTAGNVSFTTNYPDNDNYAFTRAVLAAYRTNLPFGAFRWHLMDEPDRPIVINNAWTNSK